MVLTSYEVLTDYQFPDHYLLRRRRWGGGYLVEEKNIKNVRETVNTVDCIGLVCL